MKVEQKAPKGSVGIESFQRRLRLRLPRQIYGGTQKYLTLGLDDTKENHKVAEAKARQIELDILTGYFDPTLAKYRPQTHLTLLKGVEEPQKAVTLADLWDRYAEYRKPQVAVTTFECNYQKRYRNAIQELPTKNLNEAVVIRDYLLKTKSLGTAKQLLTQFSACCTWAKKSRLISENPFLGMAAEITLPRKEEDTIDPFTKAERDAIIEAFEQHPNFKHYASFVKFLFMTGCRTSEAIGLRWKHISSDFSLITFSEALSKGIRKDTKTHKARKFPCNQSLQALLQSLKPEDVQMDDLVFTNIDGQPIKAATFLHNAWKGEESKKKLGIVTRLVQQGKVERYRPQYNTRHTFITLALENGLEVKDVARLVGNSPEIIYKHYAGSNIHRLIVPEF